MGININIYNAMLFHFAWLLCVIGGDTVAIVTSFIVLAIHLRYVSGNLRELTLLLQVMLLGLVVDSLFIIAGVLTGAELLFLPPLWLIALWLVFATTLNHCLRWFQQHLPLAILVGAVAGPLSYWAGTRMSDFALGSPTVRSIIIVSLVWALIFPLCLMLAKRYEKKQVSAEA